MYQIKKVSEKEKIKVDKLFYWLGGKHCDIFKPNDWNKLYIECRPFIDNDSYKYFERFFSYAKVKEINIVNYPLEIDEDYLLFDIFPSFEIFDELMLEHSFRLAGGIAFGKSGNWAIYSDPDNHILYFGYDKHIYTDVEKIFSNNMFLLTIEEVNSLIEPPLARPLRKTKK